MKGRSIFFSFYLCERSLRWAAFHGLIKVFVFGLRLFLFLKFFGFPISQAQSSDSLLRLNDIERESAVRSLGLGSSMKHLRYDAFPLGGDDGVEVGVSLELIPTRDIYESLGKRDLQYTLLTLGKGLFNGIEVRVSMSFPSQGESRVTYLGVQGTWIFWEASRQSPILFASLSLQASGLNYQEVIGMNSQSVDSLIFYQPWPHFSLFGGMGLTKAQGAFLGGQVGGDASSSATSTTDTRETIFNSTYGHRVILGFSIPWEPYFFSLEGNYFQHWVYSAELGLRF